MSADEMDRLFAELTKSPSAFDQREIVERIAVAVSRFMMIDEDILCPALIKSLKGIATSQSLLL